MSGAIPLLPAYAYVVWTRKTVTLLYFTLCLFLLSVCCIVEFGIIIDDYQNVVQLGYCYCNSVQPFVSLK